LLNRNEDNIVDYHQIFPLMRLHMIRNLMNKDCYLGFIPVGMTDVDNDGIRNVRNSEKSNTSKRWKWL